KTSLFPSKRGHVSLRIYIHMYSGTCRHYIQSKSYDFIFLNQGMAFNGKTDNEFPDMFVHLFDEFLRGIHYSNCYLQMVTVALLLLFILFYCKFNNSLLLLRSSLHNGHTLKCHGVLQSLFVLLHWLRVQRKVRTTIFDLLRVCLQESLLSLLVILIFI
ncbi:unnamed protein product, partial [Candidula unifasciata]